jgi:glycosyltransferase involved in cell wall biosynthesis
MPQSSPPSRRPRILQVVSHLALGGAERVALTLVEALRDEFDFSVHAVRGLEAGRIGNALAHEIETLHVPLTLGARVPMRFGGVITSGIGLTRVVRRLKPDLIHLHTEIPEAAYAAMVSWSPALRRIPLVRTIHNTVFWHFWRPLGRWCDRRMADGFIAGVSSSCVETALQLRRESGAATPPESPVSIFNGVRSIPTETSRGKSSGDRPVKIVFGGRLEPQKGTDLLPEILARVRPGDRGAHLIIFGSGAHETLLRSLSANPPNGWRVELRGPTPHFAQEISQCDLVIMPSRYEGLGLVAVEAALAETPVIATNAAGLRDVFSPDYPWLAEPGNAVDFAAKLQDALNRRDQWAATTTAAREFAAERFAISKMAGAYRSLYQRALAYRASA